jgi:hypothetical protein
MSETTSATPESGSGELTVNDAASAFMGLMGGDEGSDEGQPEEQLEASEEEESESEDESSDEYEEEEQEDSEQEEQKRTYRVKAAGEEKDVTLDELVKNYQLGADYTKKSQAVAEERKAVQAEQQAITEAKQLRDQYAQRLQVIEGILSQGQETEDLDYLKETDPIGYAVKVAELSQKEKQLSQVQAERQRLAAAQEQDRQQWMSNLVKQESAKLASVLPDYVDPEKGESLRKAVRTYGKEKLGFSDEELASVVDSRHVITLYKAMQYDRLQESKPSINKKVAEAPKIMKSGVSKSRDGNAEQYKKLKAKAMSTGRVADAAAAFERFL